MYYLTRAVKIIGKITSDQGTRSSQTNKLRTYRKFKLDYGTEYYAKSILSRNNRSALAKFKCGVAPLRIETGRFERLSVDQRICFHCTGLVKDELHVVTVCPIYQDLQDTLFAKARGLESNFDTFSDIDKLGMFCYVQQRLGSCNCQNLQ